MIYLNKCLYSAKHAKIHPSKPDTPPAKRIEQSNAKCEFRRAQGMKMREDTDIVKNVRRHSILMIEPKIQMIDNDDPCNSIYQRLKEPGAYLEYKNSLNRENQK